MAASEQTPPDQIVVFGDIHGNIGALEAAFADMNDRDLRAARYCLGDLVGYGTFPNDVVEFVRSRAIPTIIGNYDRDVGNNSDDCGCAYDTELKLLVALETIYAEDISYRQELGYPADGITDIEVERVDTDFETRIQTCRVTALPVQHSITTFAYLSIRMMRVSWKSYHTIVTLHIIIEN
jgi:hypothetical protein